MLNDTYIYVHSIPDYMIVCACHQMTLQIGVDQSTVGQRTVYKLHQTTRRVSDTLYVGSRISGNRKNSLPLTKYINIKKVHGISQALDTRNASTTELEPAPVGLCGILYDLGRAAYSHTSLQSTFM